MFLPLKIMDLSQVILLTILSTFTFFSGRVFGETSWESKENGYNGYDLQRGPVFYEAYYTDQWPTVVDQERLSESIKAEKQFSNPSSILENTYQISGNSFHGPNERQNEQHKVIDMAKETEEYENPGNSRAYNMARQLNEFAESLRQDINSNNYPIIDDTTNYISTRGEDREKTVESAHPQRENESLLKKVNSPDGKFDNYMNLILSAIKRSALEILQERMKKVSETRDKTDRNMIILRYPRFVESEYSADRRVLEMKDFPENSFSRSLKQPDSGIQENGNDEDWNKKLYDIRESSRQINDLFLTRRPSGDEDSAQSSISRMSFPPMENIFQPRPQIINYVFRPNKILAKEPMPLMMQPMRQIPASQLIISNDKPEKNNRDNLVNEISKNGKKSDEMAPEVASIEVSEITHHKIRHHHGERPRRNHHRRHIPAAP